MTPPLCECGCGQSVTRMKYRPWNRFVRGHHGRVLTREKHYNWKGGVRKCNGRIYVKSPGHARADRYGYVRRSILVAEEKYGRPILSTEDVHHINGIKTDDRPENLQVFPSRGEHMRLHLSERNKVVRYGGTKHGRAKLTNDDVRFIRAFPDYGRGAVAYLARRFGVGWNTIKRVLTGEGYRDVA